MLNRYRNAYRSASRPGAGLRPWARPAYRSALRSTKPLQFWSPPTNQARILCQLAKEILKFHKNAPEMNYDYSNSKFHTENVQFRADFPTPGLSTFNVQLSTHLKNHTENVQFRAVSPAAPTVPPNHRFTESPPPLPSEPASDYQTFLDWLQLPPPRKLPSAARALNCSLHRLRRLSAKHKWWIRADDFDETRARSTRTAFEQMLQNQTMNWRQRTEAFREQEWQLSEQMLDAAMAAVDECASHPNRISLCSALRMLELASQMGRRAAGMPVDGKEPPKPPGPPPGYPSLEEALEKIYGNHKQV